eukprot:m.8949 g.8949  ORF g.8949 m.8949 type:complete len:549 (-) comp6251_c0_seq2:54-1700(-)
MSFLASLLLGWVALHVVHIFLGWVFSHGYRAYLERNGVNVGWFSVTVKTSRFSKYFYRIGRLSPAFWRLWYSAGVFVGCVLLVIGPLFLVFNAWSTTMAVVSSSTATLPEATTAGTVEHNGSGDNSVAPTAAVSLFSQAKQLRMTPVVPGVNVPLNHIIFIFIALVVNAVVHEAGHAIAGAIHDVFIESSGVFLQLIYPGAFVELHTPHLEALKPFQQLRIFCAGVFHNMVVFGVSLMLLLTLPSTLLSYQHGSGVAVVDVHPHSPLAHALKRSDIITSVNGECSIHTKTDFAACFASLWEEKARGENGYCLEKTFVDTFTPLFPPVNAEHSDCCALISGKSSQSSLCFKSTGSEHKCIPARKALNIHTHSGVHRCVDDSGCGAGYSCWHTTLEDENTFFLIVGRRGDEDVLFLGPLEEFAMSFSVSDFVPTGRASLSYPIFMSNMLEYLVMLSPALAFINQMPCFYLDGAHTLASLLEIAFPEPAYDANRVKKFKNLVLGINTSILIYVIIFSLINAFVLPRVDNNILTQASAETTIDAPTASFHEM